jgi:hypothetical protein
MRYAVIEFFANATRYCARFWASDTAITCASRVGAALPDSYKGRDGQACQRNSPRAAPFNGAPDSRFISHPISFGSGDWTVATDMFEATFSEAMKMPDGTSIPPTGKAVKISMATIRKVDKRVYS